MNTITIRPATPADAKEVGRILFDAFGCIANAHRFPLDFPVPEAAAGLAEMVVNHPGYFGVVAERDGKVVGSNFLDERDAVAAVGPITVDPAAQGGGVGRALMQAVLGRAVSQSHKSVRLVQDAFNTASMSLYASLGFEAKEPLALMQGRPNGVPKNGDVSPIALADIDACAALCRAVHGFDRSNELADAIPRFQPMLLRREGQVVAYASAPHFWFLNHGIAASEQDMFDLLAGIAALRSEPLMLLLPIRQAAFHRWCLQYGMRMLKPMTLMTIGDYQQPAGCFYPSVAY
jgi:predicted N-acetyltransferase YhbS